MTPNPEDGGAAKANRALARIQKSLRHYQRTNPKSTAYSITVGLAGLIGHARQKRRMSDARLAKLAGVTMKQLGRIQHGDDMNALRIARVLLALRVDPRVITASEYEKMLTARTKEKK